jgi:hypothetical protein
MPEEEMLRYLRDGRVGMVSDAASNVMDGLSKLGQLHMLKYSKLVSWLKPSLEIETNFEQFFMVNKPMPLRLWNAKIWSSSTLNPLDSILSATLSIFIDSFPLMEIFVLHMQAEGGRRRETIRRTRTIMDDNSVKT